MGIPRFRFHAPRFNGRGNSLGSAIVIIVATVMVGAQIKRQGFATRAKAYIAAERGLTSS